MSVKTVLAINGSPRRKGNTAELLTHALRGAKEAGANTEIVHLYTLNFKGCVSCFACKRKDKEHGICALQDDLTPVLERIKEVDAIMFGSPIYFMNISSGLLACLERLFFSHYLYSKEIPTVFPKKMPSAFFLHNEYNRRAGTPIPNARKAGCHGVFQQAAFPYSTS
ncbi:MAG: flavodoxin family protein [Desulfovibrio sp.]|nr:flavodoxin family protein [Desulfovibrio sp.]